MRLVRSELTLEDLRYILKNTPDGMGRAMLKKRISELEKRRADEAENYVVYDG